jgi:ATP-dependent RNA helicase DeaD
MSEIAVPTTFEDLNLRPEILKACRKQGFKEPTPIQAIVVPVVAEGRDVIVEAKTGSGKTLAYGLPLLNREPMQTLLPEVLIIVPTRELSQQIESELIRTRGTLARSVVSLTGGGGMDRQREWLAAGATFVVGTSGRLRDLLKRKFLHLERVRTIVLDEVDELLRGGFAAELSEILVDVPTEHQTLLFSATIPTEVETLARSLTKQAARLRTQVSRELPAELTHRAMFTTVDNRIHDLAAYLRADKPYQAVIFCGTRHETEEVKEALVELGLEGAFLHGELSPNKRKQLLEKMRSGELPLLVASDLAARGLDLPGVDLIVNYSLPHGTAPYLHRAGRTGRAGRPGVVLSMVIGQQYDVFEKLTPTFKFESVGVASRRVITHQMMTREERDLQHRKLPPPKRRWEDTPPKAPPAPKEKERPARADRSSEERPAKAARPHSRSPKSGPRPSRPKPPRTAKPDPRRR